MMLLCCLLTLPACQRRAPAPAESLAAVPLNAKVGVAAFTQPLTTSELIAGVLPEKQGRAPEDVFPQLDAFLRGALGSAKRMYVWLPKRVDGPGNIYHDSATPMALSQWVAFGRQFGVDLLLTPQIINWSQREGSAAGVTNSAHVRAEFFLIDVKKGRVLRRSIFEEKQVGLADDILRAGNFFRRGGAWVTAEELAREAALKAVKELGL